MKGNVLKIILVLFGIGIYWNLQNPTYQIVEPSYGNYDEFHNTQQGYQLRLPSDFLQPVEACPLQTNGLQLLTYFTPPTGQSSGVFFIIGSFKDRDNMWGFIKRQLELLESKAIDETKFMQEVRSSGKSELRKINGYWVYIASVKNSNHFDQQVMFISNDTLIGFMLSAPLANQNQLVDIVNSLQPL